MAYKVSDRFREIEYSGEAEWKASLTIGDNEIPTSNIKQITISDPLIDTTSDTMYIGSFVSKQVEVSFNNAEDIDLTQKLHLEIGLNVDGEYEYVPIGDFNIETSPEDYYSNVKITALDDAVKFKTNVDISQFFDKEIKKGELLPDNIINSESVSYLEPIYGKGETYHPFIISYQGDKAPYKIEGFPGTQTFLYFIECESDSYYNISYYNSDWELAVGSTKEAPTYGTPVYDYSQFLDESGDIKTVSGAKYLVFNTRLPLEEFLESVEVKKYKLDIIETGNTISKNLLKSLCDYYGIELGSYPTVNNDVVIASYDNTISGKQYISWLAELMGSNAKIGRDGKLYLIPVKQEPTVTIEANKGKSFTKNEKYKISRVRYDNGVVTPSEFGGDTDNTLYIRTDNIFISGTDDKRDSIVENIYNAVNGLEVWSMITENYGDISLDSTDIVTYTANGEEYNTYYNSTFTYNGVIMNKVSVSIPTKQVEETTNVVRGDAATLLKKISTEINQIDNTLSINVAKTQDLDTTVGNNYKEIMDKFANIPTNDSIKGTITTSVNETLGDYYKKTEINAIINGEDTDGNIVSYVKTKNITLDLDGITVEAGTGTDGQIQKDNIKSNLNEKGLKLLDNSNNKLLYVGFDDETQETVVESKNLKVEKYFQMGSYSRFENYTDDNEISGTGCFWVGD